MISVSIIIPAWNEATTIRATLEALLSIEYDKKWCEVIVVSGGNDNTFELSRKLAKKMDSFSRYVVLPQRPMGKNAAIQQGIREARNDVIVLLDGDTIVSSKWLRGMIEPIEKGDCDLAVANAEPVKRNWVSDYFMILKTCLLESITMFPGGSIAFVASIVENRLEYFFERNFRAGVDYLLMKRFMEQGLKVMFARDARVTTHYPHSLRGFVVSELRWLTALTNIEGFRVRAFACNIAVVAALMFALPIHKTLVLLSLVFNATYVGKRVRMFFFASREYSMNVKNVCGFIVLSYIYHVLGLVAHMRFLLGMSKQSYLRQGQR